MSKLKTKCEKCEKEVDVFESVQIDGKEIVCKKCFLLLYHRTSIKYDIREEINNENRTNKNS